MPRLGVDAHRRLIEKQQFRVMDDADDQVDAPFHPAGIGADLSVALVIEAEHLQVVFSPIAQRLPVNTIHHSEIIDVFKAAQTVVEGQILRHQTDSPANPSRVAEGIDAGDEEGSALGTEQGGEDRD